MRKRDFMIDGKLIHHFDFQFRFTQSIKFVLFQRFFLQFLSWIRDENSFHFWYHLIPKQKWFRFLCDILSFPLLLMVTSYNRRVSLDLAFFWYFLRDVWSFTFFLSVPKTNVRMSRHVAHLRSALLSTEREGKCEKMNPKEKNDRGNKRERRRK